MACGAPIVVSNRAALPEVVDDAGLLFDPEREPEIAATIARVLADAALAGDLRRRALARAGLFTAARTSERVFELLRTVADRRGASA
jgi:glycosyltransferase involved in cell wall biosynthesis